MVGGTELLTGKVCAPVAERMVTLDCPVKGTSNVAVTFVITWMYMSEGLGALTMKSRERMPEPSAFAMAGAMEAGVSWGLV